jgi:hypothetical protein
VPFSAERKNLQFQKDQSGKALGAGLQLRERAPTTG